MMAFFMKWGSVGIYALGVLFCLCSCLSVRRLSLIAVFGVAAFLVFRISRARRLVARMVDFALNRPVVTFIALSVVAVALRIVFYFRILEVGLQRIQKGDATYFWNYAQEMASGSFPDVKSWTAVFSQAVSIKLFGDSVVPVFCLNSVLQVCTAAALFAFAKKNLSLGAAMFVAAVSLLSPSIVRLNCATMSESLYYLFLALSLLAVSVWIRDRRFPALLAMPLLIWLTIWTRGEGVLLLLIVPTCLLIDCLRVGRENRTRSAWALGALCILLVGFASLGYAINVRYHGTHTPMCSYDSWWPRLYGSNVASKGRVPGPKTSPKGMKLLSDKTIMLERYRKDHAGDPDGGKIELKPMHCPTELIPYIKAEISRRWAALSFWEKVRFVMVKEWLPWNNPYTGRGEVPDQRMGRILVSDILTTLAILLCCIGLIERIIGVMRERSSGDALLQCIPLLYLFGIVCTMAVAESCIRHGTIALLICPLYAFPKAQAREF